MQAIMLAAGMGRRLGKYTGANTKCMLRVNGQTLLERAVEALKLAGVTKLILVVGYQAQNLKDYVAKAISGIEIEYVENPDFATTNNIYSLWLARDHLAADDTILLESDLIFEPDIIQSLVEYPAPDVATVARYEQWMDGTVTLLDSSDRIVEFVEKKNFVLSRACDYFKTVNVYKFSRKFSENHYLPFLEAYIRAYGQNEYYEQVLKAIAHLAHSGLMAFKLTHQKWYEIDDAQDLDIAETLFAKGSDKLVRYQQRYGGYWRFPSVLDFCYLVNPYFPTPELVGKIKYFLEALLTQYPSGQYVQEINAGRMFDADESQLVVGNGAAEIIAVLGQLTEGGVAVPKPTFNEYYRCFSHCAFHVVDTSHTNFLLEKADILRAARIADTVVVVNPDNPSGALVPRNDMLEIAEYCDRNSKRLIVDESFMDFADPDCAYTFMTPEALQKYPRILVVKSIGKSYGVPGLRLGVAVSGDANLLQELKRRLPVWNINSFAEYFLQIFPIFRQQYHAACHQIREQRRFFQNLLQAVPYLKVYPSQANYFLCEVLGGRSSTELTQDLIARHHILIKDLCGKDGFSDRQFIRLAVRNAEDNQRLVRALMDLI